MSAPPNRDPDGPDRKRGPATGPGISRLARVLVSPLAATPAHPNHITTLSLLLALSAAVLFALGEGQAANWAAFLFMLAGFIDHGRWRAGAAHRQEQPLWLLL